MEKLSTIVIFVVLVFASLFIYTKTAGPIPFNVNNINTNAKEPFQAEGSGSAAAAPDKALISLGITQSASKVLDAQGKANEASEKIINSLKNLGIPDKDIKTTGYSINPNYDYTSSSQRITGYSITQNFEVKVPIEKANEAIDGATSAGANLVGNISFILDDEKEQELKNTARKEAVDAAKKSAEGLAKASGIRLGKIINVSENFIGGLQPFPFTREAVGGDLQVEKTNITPGETKVEVTVTLTYQTY